MLTPSQRGYFEANRLTTIILTPRQTQGDAITATVGGMLAAYSLDGEPAPAPDRADAEAFLRDSIAQGITSFKAWAS